MKQIRVLHCNNDNKNMGGAYLITRRLDPYMRQYGYVFDYMTMDEFAAGGTSETDPPGDARTFSARLRGNRLIGHMRLPFYVKKVFRDNPYKIVHIDIDSAWKALLYAVPAKLSGAKVLVHSHATGIDGDHKGLKGMLHTACKKILSKYTDKYIGCSRKAIEWLCPEKRLSKATVLRNGIDRNEFFFDEKLRDQTRRELRIEDRFVVCNVGRINDNKNQIFLIDVLKELQHSIPSALLILVGPYDEYDYTKLMQKIRQEELENSVQLIGNTNHVNRYLNAADYYVQPSIFEGMSLAGIEAQSTGLRCLFSTGNPPETVVTDLTVREPLEYGAKYWAETVFNSSRKQHDRKSVVFNSQFTIMGMAQSLAAVYGSLYKER